jgi:hypothetical protein
MHAVRLILAGRVVSFFTHNHVLLREKALSHTQRQRVENSISPKRRVAAEPWFYVDNAQPSGGDQVQHIPLAEKTQMSSIQDSGRCVAKVAQYDSHRCAPIQNVGQTYDQGAAAPQKAGNVLKGVPRSRRCSKTSPQIITSKLSGSRSRERCSTSAMIN